MDSKGKNQHLETTMKLLIKFLKMHGHMNMLYNNTAHKKLVSKSFMSNISCSYIRLWQKQKEYETSNYHHLALSQFWRFYVLEHIDEYPRNMKEKLKGELRRDLALNGIRMSEELKELFKKHNIYNGNV